MSPEQRARLAEKGRILYRKACGSGGNRTCAESFAFFQIARGNVLVAHDLLAFLQSEVERLRRDDPDQRLTATEAMAEKIRRGLPPER